MHYSIIIFETIAFLLLGAILVIRIRQNRYREALLILSGAIYGVILEFAMVAAGNSYSYNTQFVVQIGETPRNVPICIGLYWGMIIYACMTLSDKLGFSIWTRPLLDAALALTIDLSMDTIAIRLAGGYWNWTGIPKESTATLNSFFGVHYGNFVGWFLVVFIFSSLARVEKRIINNHLRRPLAWTAIAFAVLPAVSAFLLYYGLGAIFLPLNWLSEYLTHPGLLGTPQGKIVIMLITLAVVTVFVHLVDWRRRGLKIESGIDRFSSIIFVFFHGLFLAFYFLEGMQREAPMILLVAGIVIMVDVVVHIPLFRKMGF